MPDRDDGKPNIARVYDFWMGGKHHTASDRKLGKDIAGRWPDVPRQVRASRWFLIRAVRYVTGCGIGQFIDLGSGLPASPGIHETARETIPGARVAYVDDDPVVMEYARAILDGDEDAAAIDGDLTGPGAVYASEEFAKLIAFAEPACLIMSMVLHFLDPEEAARVVREAIAPLAPGSYVIISSGYADAQSAREFAGMYTAAPVHTHPRADWDSWLDGLELVPPGVADVTDLSPGAPSPGTVRRTRGVMGVIARIPAGYQPPA